jgi:hypothetical protein
LQIVGNTLAIEQASRTGKASFHINPMRQQRGGARFAE